MKFRTRALVGICLLAILSSCQRQRQKVIAVIPKGTASIFWIAVEAGALAAGKENQVEIVWTGPAQETDYSRQIEIVDSMVTRHVDGIALAAAERKALVRPVERAVAAGIPITVFDSGLDFKDYVSFVATNNYEGGRLAAHTLAGLMHGKGKVAILMHAPGSASTMDRERGFTDVLQKEFPEMHVVATKYGEADASKARAGAENIFTAQPDLEGIFSSSERSSLGVALALKSRNLSGKIKFVAFDSSDAIVADLKNGTIDALVVQDPFKLGHEAVQTLVDKLNGKTPAKSIDLAARVLRKDDLDKPDVKELLAPDIKKYLP